MITYYDSAEKTVWNLMLKEKEVHAHKLESVESIRNAIAFTFLNAEREVVILSNRLDRKIFGSREVCYALEEQLKTNTAINYDVHLKAMGGDVTPSLMLLINNKIKSKFVVESQIPVDKEIIIADGKFGVETGKGFAIFRYNPEWAAALSAQIKESEGKIIKETAHDSTIFQAPRRVRKAGLKADGFKGRQREE